MMMIGRKSAQSESRNALSRTAPLSLGAIVMPVERRAEYAHTAVRDRPMSRPGTIPAMNSLVTEMLAATPKMMKEIEGGMMGAMIPPAAIRPVDWPMS